MKSLENKALTLQYYITYTTITSILLTFLSIYIQSLKILYNNINNIQKKYDS